MPSLVTCTLHGVATIQVGNQGVVAARQLCEGAPRSAGQPRPPLEAGPTADNTQSSAIVSDAVTDDALVRRLFPRQRRLRSERVYRLWFNDHRNGAVLRQ